MSGIKCGVDPFANLPEINQVPLRISSFNDLMTLARHRLADVRSEISYIQKQQTRIPNLEAELDRLERIITCEELAASAGSTT